MGASMTALSPSAAAILADLTALGIDVKAHGDALHYRPRPAMTPDLLQRLQAHKAEVLRLLDTGAVVAELRQSVERLRQDPAWRSAWDLRFRAAQYADFASLQRVLDAEIDRAVEHHRRRDWKAFSSACRYLHRLAMGELWDEAEQIAAKFRG